LFSSDSEDDGSSDIGGSDSDASRKRLKSSPSSVESVGPRRHLLCEKAFAEEAVIDIVHGADATSGEYEKKFRNLWQDEDFETVTLQYPSLSQRERFELKHPVNAAEDYKPLDDITETVKIIVLRYFPSHLHTLYSHDETGYERRFNRALQRQSVADFIEVLHDFNNTLHTFLKDGTIQAHLRTHRALDLDWVERILGQIYARTVSPKVESLRAYQNGSDNVYGELLPRFCSEIFQKTALNHEQIFIDLGSGVGNVVLQAALEIGCESWGIEMMPNPCELAALQAKEFPARSRLWGLSVGDVHLLKGDFTNSPPEIESVFKRADVVLVNNQAFTPQLNDKLRDKFLDLKNGCKVVSLKPFVPLGHRIQMRNASSPVNLFTQKRYEYWSGCVSWGAQSGDYFVATKDPRPLEKFMRENGHYNVPDVVGKQDGETGGL
jgi:H3 lysine-79-specific histone-lysine N-methyltransferase